MEPEPIPDEIQNDDIEKSENMNIRKFYSIETTKVYREALRMRVPKKYPVDYTVAQVIPRNPHETLFQAKNKDKYSEKTRRVCEQVLRAYTPGNSPVKYMAIQRNQGTTYNIPKEESRPDNSLQSRENSKIVDSISTSLKNEQENYIERVSKRAIMTDRDELYRCLSRHLDRLPTRRNWITPLGILATIVIAIVTSTFKPVLGIDSDTWYSIFVTAGLITFIWFIVILYIDIKSRDMKSIFEDIIEDLSRHCL